MHWVLQENIFKEEAYDRLIEQIERFGYSYSVHKVVPFVGELLPEPQLDTDNVICFGSYSMRHSAKKYGWFPGVFDLEPYDFTQQLHHWGDLMLNADAVVSRFEDAVFPNNEPHFVRPIHDSKVFAGKVYEKDDFYNWKRNVCVLEHDYGDSLTKNTLVQVCSPKQIYSEVRCWVVDNKVVTASVYKRGDRVIYSSDVDAVFYDFATQVLRTMDQRANILAISDNLGWAPQRAFCLDLADTPEGMKVVEINTINSSGFYAADLQKLVAALGRFERK